MQRNGRSVTVSKAPRMIKCPAEDCEVRFEEDDHIAQQAHLAERHPKIVADRLRAIGRHLEADNYLKEARAR